MGNICFYAMIFVVFLQFTFGAINFSGVNRTFLSMYKGVFESSLITVGENGEPVYPYFDEVTLRNGINSYLHANLKPYVKKFDTSMRLYTLDDSGMCLGRQCSKVEVSLKADINAFFKYSKSVTYYVKEAF